MCVLLLFLILTDIDLWLHFYAFSGHKSFFRVVLQTDFPDSYHSSFTVDQSGNYPLLQANPLSYRKRLIV